MDRNVSRRWLLRRSGAGAAVLGVAGCLRLSDSGDGESAPTETSDSTAETTSHPPADTTEDTETETPQDDGRTEQDRLRIGLLQPLSGSFSDWGTQSVRGFYAGLAYHGASPAPTGPDDRPRELTVGDVPVEVLIRDTEADPSVAGEWGQELVSEQTVDALVGTSLGACTAAVADLARTQGTPFLVGPTPASAVTNGDICGREIFRTSATTAMLARASASYVDGAFDSAYLLLPDFAAGDVYAEQYEQILDSGAEIVGRRSVPIGTSEYRSYLDDAADAEPEVMVAPLTYPSFPTLLEQFLAGDYDFRVHTQYGPKGWADEVGELIFDHLQERGMEITPETVGRSANVAPFVTPYHWSHYNSAINDRFRELYRSTYRSEPDIFASGLFAAASALVQATGAAGSTDAADLLTELRGMEIRATPKGEGGYAFREVNNQATSSVTVGYLTAHEDPAPQDSGVRLVSDGVTVDGDDAVLPRSQVDCSL